MLALFTGFVCCVLSFVVGACCATYGHQLEEEKKNESK